MWTYNNTDELYHYGILGMKWGVRRYQNKDGSLTPEGKRQYKYYNDIESKRKKFKNNLDKEGNALIKKSKKLSYDFGKHENVDDHEYFRNIAKSYKLNTKKYEKSLNEYINNRKINIQNKKKINKAKKIVDKINKNNKKIQLKKERLNKALDYQKETKNKSSSKISTDKEYKKMQNDFKKIIRDDYENNEKLISFTKNELKNEQSKEGKKILKQTLNKLNEDKKKFQKDLDDIDNRSDFYTKEYFKNKRN